MPDLHAAWERIVNVAIAGVARQEPPALETDDAVGGFCAGLPAGEPPARFLNLAGTVTLCQLAGARPAPATAPAPDPAPDEPLASCSPAATNLLRRALDESLLTPLLAEWMNLALRHGQVIPPDALPAALRAMAKSAEVRQVLLPVLGARGRWLAGLNPDWRACAQPEGEADCREAWETGSPKERLTALRMLRATDADGARALLEDARPSEPLESLAALIAALEVGLSLADEPFLESLLDDKRKTIRRPAAELLARLPGSAYQQRMVERARACLAVTPAVPGTIIPPRLKQPVKLVVTLPDAFNVAWARDAVEETPPPGIGPKSWWLQQLLAGAPLAAWEAAGPCEPAELIEAAKATENTDLLLNGWLLAAQRQRHVGWIAAVLVALSDESRGRSAEVFQELMPPEREQVLLALLASDPNARWTAADLLRYCPAPWSEALSARVMTLTIPADERWRYEPLAYYLHPRHLSACRQRFDVAAGEATGAVETRLRAVMTFREELYPAFEECI